METFNFNFEFDKADFKDFYDYAPNIVILEIGNYIDSDGDEYYFEFYHDLKDDTFEWIACYEYDNMYMDDARENNIILDPIEFKKVKSYMRERKKVELKVNENVKMTDEDIDDIMASALEGGITYWCDEAKVDGDYLGEYASDQISRGGNLFLHDMEENKYYKLSLENLKNGINKYINDPDSPYQIVEGGMEGMYVNTMNVDADVADMIVQYGVFGEYVYG